MAITLSISYACDHAGCTTTLNNTDQDTAATAGWTFGQVAYPVNGAPPNVEVHCPAHS